MTRNLMVNEKDQHLVRSIVNMGQGLGFELLAEGVETAEQALCLSQLGAHQGQGYLFSPAVPAQEVFDLVSRSLPLDLSQGGCRLFEAPRS